MIMKAYCVIINCSFSDKTESKLIFCMYSRANNLRFPSKRPKKNAWFVNFFENMQECILSNFLKKFVWKLSSVPEKILATSMHILYRLAVPSSEYAAAFITHFFRIDSRYGILKWVPSALKSSKKILIIGVSCLTHLRALFVLSDLFIEKFGSKFIRIGFGRKFSWGFCYFFHSLFLLRYSLIEHLLSDKFLWKHVKGVSVISCFILSCSCR